MFAWVWLVPASSWIMSGRWVVGKNLPLGIGLLSLGCPGPLGLAAGLTGLFLSTVGHLLLLLLPSLGSYVAGIIDGVDFGVFR